MGYRSIKMEERTSEWRKGNFHRYTHPWARRGVKLSLHKDQWKQPPQSSHTKQKTNEKDIEQELQRIQALLFQ